MQSCFWHRCITISNLFCHGCITISNFFVMGLLQSLTFFVQVHVSTHVCALRGEEVVSGWTYCAEPLPHVFLARDSAHHAHV